ncbi:hypothetical protein DFJ77DRAFT_460102 [Powellomyces hirtus]|nr:hypothetical protein DFJ77DRAFT_460102 [Powellomyces hirtus]
MLHQDSTTTRRQLGVLRNQAPQQPMRRSSAPSHGTRPIIPTGSSSSNNKRRSDGDSHLLNLSFPADAQTASIEFLDHLQSCLKSATRCRINATSHTPQKSSESAHFVQGWLSTLQATEEQSRTAKRNSTGSAPTPRPSSPVDNVPPRSADADAADKRNSRSLLDMLDSKIAELTIDIEQSRPKPLASQSSVPHAMQMTRRASTGYTPSTAPLPGRPPSAASQASGYQPLQALVEELERLAERKPAVLRRSAVAS